jgi:hypothetical protein
MFTQLQKVNLLYFRLFGFRTFLQRLNNENKRQNYFIKK